MLGTSRQKELANRLRRIEGQIRGIEKMIAKPRLCVDILQQLAAVSAALERVRGGVIRHHLERCVPHAIRRGGAEQRRHLAELSDIVDRFCR